MIENAGRRVARQLSGVSVRFPRGRSPEELARAVCATLARPPSEWQATWQAFDSEVTAPPTIAGPSWQREQL